MQNIESKNIQRHSSGVGSQSQSGSSSSQDSAKMEDVKQIMHRLGFAIKEQ